MNEKIINEIDNLFNINDFNNIKEYDIELKQKSKRARVVLIVLKLFQEHPEISIDDLKNHFAEKHGEEVADKMIQIIVSDMHALTKEIEISQLSSNKKSY